MSHQSDFDDRLDAAKESLEEDRKASADAQILLESVGVSPEQIAFIMASPSLVDLLLRKPDLAQAWAAQYPSGTVNDYATQAQQLGFGDYGAGLDQAGQADAARLTGLAEAYGMAAPQTSTVGGVRYPGGVLVNPMTGQVTFPNDPTVAGSGLWLASVYTWTDDKVDKWRSDLFDAGYLDKAKGGKTPEFIEALRTFHINRYLYGGGKPVSLESTTERVTEKDFDGLLDPAVLEGEARTWIANAYGDEGSPEERKYWSSLVAKEALRLARKKDYSPSSAASVAASKIEQKFYDSPQARTAIDNDFENTSLKEDLQMAASATEFLAFGR